MDAKPDERGPGPLNEDVDLATETALEDDLLEEFYAFMYEAAVLVGHGGPTGSPPKTSGKDSPIRASSPSKKSSPSKPAGSEGPTASHLAQTGGAVPVLSRELMNAMLPPKSWKDEHGKWQRMVSLASSSRGEVQRLQEVFVQLLEEHQARASAICPVREKFFLQVFEELIREVACECPERGLLLLRLRDELRLTVEGYQTLYHNSIAYGRQKAVQAEVGIVELEDRIRVLEADQAELCAARHQLSHRLMFVQAQATEDQSKRAMQHRQAVQFLRDQQRQLETFHDELTQDSGWR